MLQPGQRAGGHAGLPRASSPHQRHDRQGAGADDLVRTFTAADVIGPADQGISAGEFDELVKAMRNGVTYANVHSSTFPMGEIRAQLERSDEDDD